MTPAIEQLKRLDIAHEVLSYTHEPSSTGYGLEACDKLGLPSDQVFKTLVVTDESDKLAVMVVPVASRLNLKRAAKALGVKKLEMADPKAVMRSTGYVLGGVSPLGQKKRLPTVIDSCATTHTTMYVSAGRRGLEVALAPQDLAQALGAVWADIQERD